MRENAPAASSVGGLQQSERAEVRCGIAGREGRVTVGDACLYRYWQLPDSERGNERLSINNKPSKEQRSGNRDPVTHSTQSQWLYTRQYRRARVIAADSPFPGRLKPSVKPGKCKAPMSGSLADRIRPSQSRNRRPLHQWRPTKSVASNNNSALGTLFLFSAL